MLHMKQYDIITKQQLVDQCGNSWTNQTIPCNLQYAVHNGKTTQVPYGELILENIKYILALSIIYQHWDGIDSWNTSSWKTQDYAVHPTFSIP